ncbi:DUF6578 domain-containing protein [Streptomyces roseicoloratus]|uniref:DUF6578 domain-containing protein n=1 Tax=Streptomyces roseicoloratus TaxID=2508722 RepID=UPI003CCC62B8
MQCCGESFAPGDVVSWTLLEVDPEDYADVVGGGRAGGDRFPRGAPRPGGGARTHLG